MAKAHSFWRPPNGLNSKDYRAYMEHPDPLHLPFPLEDHLIGGLNQNLSDSLAFNTVEWKNGKVVTISKTARVAEEISRDYTLGFPSGALWSPAKLLAETGGCPTDFYAVYACPTSPCYEHFYVFPEAQLDPPTDDTDMFTRDDTNMIQESATMHITHRMFYIHVDGNEINDLSTLSTPLTAVEDVIFATECCETCSSCHNRIIAVGQIGATITASPVVSISNDRGRTFTTFDLGADVSAPLGIDVMFATSVVNICDYILVTLADTGGKDEASTGGAATGAVAFSHDAGATWAYTDPATHDMDEALYTSFVLNDVPYVAGAGGEIWRSENLQEWTQVEHQIAAVLATTIVASDVEPDGSQAYMVGLGGIAIMWDGTAILDVSTTLQSALVAAGFGATDDLYAINVINRDRIQVGGAAGIFAETANTGDVWRVLGVAGTADDILTIVGDKYRIQVGSSGNVVYQRDLLTNLTFTAVDYLYGSAPTGGVVGLSIGENVNVSVAGHRGGGLVMIRPCYPDLCGEYATAAQYVA